LKMSDNYIYPIDNSIYINLTNRCTNACSFCIRDGREGMNGYGLWLKREPTAGDVTALLTDAAKYDEAVFCGFGEPLFKLDEVKHIGAFLKAQGVRVRINTNGHGSRIHGRNIAPELVGALDVVSISLNAPDAARYQEICKSAYGEQGFDIMLDFANSCVREGLEVVLSVVDTIGADEIEACRKLAAERVPGSKFRVRGYY